MARWIWILTVSAVAVGEATVTCDEQYLGFLLSSAGVAADTVAACTETSNYALDKPQVPASGQILVDVCNSDACVSILQALDGQSDCNLPNCSATESMASWPTASGNESASGSGDAADDIVEPDAASSPLSPPTGASNAAAGVGISIVAALVPLCVLLA